MLLQPRPPAGAPAFELQVAREDEHAAAEAKRARHRGPGMYDVR